MNGRKVDDAIKKYCEKMNYLEAFNAIIDVETISSKKLEDIFGTFFEKHSGKKLSFSYATSNKQSLLKKRLANMNEDYKKSNEKVKVNKKKSENNLEKIPESFLILMDELCLDRKNARQFYENPSQWAHVKSDRKIFCTKNGKNI